MRPSSRREKAIDSFAIFIGLVFLLTPSATADWPMEGYDGGRTSAAPGEFPERYEVAWVFNGTSSGTNNLVASSEMVFYTEANESTRHNTFRAISVASGEEVWNLTPSSSVFFNDISSSALAEELVIISGLTYTIVNETLRTDIYVRALSTVNGEERWNYFLDNILENGLVVEGNKVYAVDWTGTIHVLNLTTGELLFRHHLGSSNVWTWAMVDGVVYYYADYSGEESSVGAFDTMSNTSLWKYPIEYREEGIMVVEGRVFYGARGTFYVLNATTGELIDTYSDYDFGIGGSRWFMVSNMAYSQGMFVATISDEKHIVAKKLDGGPGDTWSHPFSGGIAIGDGKVFVQEGNSTISNLRVLDLFTGEELDVFIVEEGAAARNPILSDGRIYFTTDGHLYALRKLRQPDLAVADLALTPADNLREGDRANLTFTLANRGDRGARNGTVTIYDNGAPLGSEPLANVTVGWERNYSVAWDTTGRPGWHDLTVAVEGVEPEDFNLSDNRATLRVYVRPLRVDGALLGAVHAPAEPKVGDVVAFNVTVANAGETELENLSVVIYDNGTRAVNATLAALEVGENRSVTLEWPAASAGSYNLTLALEGISGDANLTNDTLTLAVTVRELRRDLAVTGLALAPAQPTAGRSVTLNATVANPGEEPVEAAVRFYLGEELLGQVSVSVEPGASTAATLAWVPPRAGPQTLTAEVVDDYGDYRPEDNQFSQEVSVRAQAESSEGRPWAYVGAVVVLLAVAAAGVWRWRRA